LKIEDKSLSSWVEKAKSQITDSRERGPQFRVENGVLWRIKEKQGREFKQLAVPQQLPDKVMKLGRYCIMSGHQGIKKTYDRITEEFLWPGVSGDVSRYCQSCDICQRTVPKGRVSKVRRSLVPDSRLTGETIICGLIDGTLKRNPAARISVYTPFLKGEVKATCMSSAMYDL